MLRIRKFFTTTLLGGLVAILPLSLLVILFRWIINLIEKYLEPLVNLVDTDSRMANILAYLIAVAAILALFFFIGLFIQTRVGKYIRNTIEENYLIKIPGYKTAREIVMQFFGGNKSFFSEVVLVDIFGSGALMTGFITDDNQEDIVTVFVPTGPNPTSGNIYHVQRERILKSNLTVDSGMKTIISCGAGSSEIFNKLNTKKETDASQ